MSDAEEGIEHGGFYRVSAMQLDAVFCQFDRKCGRVGALTFAAFDSFVGNKPVVASTAFVFPLGVPPAGNVAFMRVGNTYGQSIESVVACFSQMKQILVAVCEVSF